MVCLWCAKLGSWILELSYGPGSGGESWTMGPCAPGALVVLRRVFYLCRLRAPTQKGQVVERRPNDYDCYDI